MRAQMFQGTGRIIRLLFRQNRFKILLWLIGIIGVSLAVAYVYPEVYTVQEEIYGFGITMDNPAMKAMLGPTYAVEEFTNTAVIYASEMLLFTAVAAGAMNILLMNSSTRLDEDEGRLEMIQSLPTGRLSYLTAAVILLFLINLTLVAVLAPGLAFAGEAAYSWESSFLYSINLGVTGFFFGAATAVFAQLSDSSKGNLGLAFGLLILSYIVRAVGDVLSEAAALVSPLGWTVRTDVFVSDNWLPILVLGGAALILLVVAFYLNHRRDMFAGLLPVRSGSKEASAFLKTPAGLVWHLEKTKIISWFFILFLLTAAFGSILGELETYFSDMDLIQQFFQGAAGTDMAEQFVIYVVQIMSIFTAIPAVTMMMDLRKEEKLNRTEHFYGRSVSRTKIMGTYYLMGLVVSVFMQLAIALGFYVTASQSMEGALTFGTAVEMTLIYLPALWFLLGLVTFLIGVFPKAAQAVWLYVVFVFIVLYLGALFEFPDWLSNLSVFNHIPGLPAETVEWPVLLIICAATILFTLIGLIGYHRRDMEG